MTEPRIPDELTYIHQAVDQAARELYYLWHGDNRIMPRWDGLSEQSKQALRHIALRTVRAYMKEAHK